MASIKAMCTAWGQDPGHDEDGFRLRIDGSSHAAARARREMARLDAELDAALLENMRLLVTELVSNSVRHAGASAVELTVAMSPQWVRVEVANTGDPFSADANRAERGPDPGWGLFLVESLSNDWGVLDDTGCQRVWFEIARA